MQLRRVLYTATKGTIRKRLRRFLYNFNVVVKSYERAASFESERVGQLRFEEACPDGQEQGQYHQKHKSHDPRKRERPALQSAAAFERAERYRILMG